MEVTNRRPASTQHAAFTRVYSPTHGSSAYAYAEEPAAQPLPERERRQQPQAAPSQQRRTRVQSKPALNAACRATLLFAMAVLGAAGLFVMFRYHNISQQYAVVNRLQTDIEQAQQRISILNVSLESSVNIGQLQEAAKRMGMTYPSASQYILAGEAVPYTSPATNSTPPVDTGPQATDGPATD